VGGDIRDFDEYVRHAGRWSSFPLPFRLQSGEDTPIKEEKGRGGRGGTAISIAVSIFSS